MPILASSCLWFAKQFPLVAQDFPLHADRSVAAQRRLLSGATRERLGLQIKRATTFEVDKALGARGFVHFYLLREDVTPNRPGHLLDAAKLIEAKLKLPLPHGVLLIPTSDSIPEG